MFGNKVLLVGCLIRSFSSGCWATLLKAVLASSALYHPLLVSDATPCSSPASDLAPYFQDRLRILGVNQTLSTVPNACRVDHGCLSGLLSAGELVIVQTTSVEGFLETSQLLHGNNIIWTV